MHDLRDEVDDQQMVDRFAVDWTTAGLDAATTGLLEFAEKLTDECAAVGKDDIEVLRSHGFDDQGISSCVQVVAYFNYINRIAEGLGVAMEDWIEDNGRPKRV
ncbi:MAG TPA: peroxidase [Acidimicrobiia bacterium]|nr:peroxidase [Acidimicrobiia bacterium]